MTSRTPAPRPRHRIGAPKRQPPKVLVPVKMTLDQRRRFKVACAESNMSYADLVMDLLNERERALERARRAQAHPLHHAIGADGQQIPLSSYPGGSHAG